METETWTEIAVLKEHKSQVLRAEFSPDGSRILTLDKEGLAFIWDMQNLNNSVAIEGIIYSNLSVPFNPDGSKIVAISNDGPNIWDTQTGKKVLNLRTNEEKVSAVKFSPDGKRIITGSADNTTYLWDAKTGKIISTLQDHTHIVFSSEFSPDSRYIITITGDPEVSTLDKVARVWDAKTGTQLVTLQGINHDFGNIAFSPDGSRIITLDSGNANIWDIQTGEHVAMLTEGFGRYFNLLQFSPDGKYIDALIISSDGYENQDGVNVQRQKSYMKRWPLSTVFHNTITGENPPLDASDPKQYVENLLSRSCWWLNNYLNAYPEKHRDLKTFCDSLVNDEQS